MEYKEKTKENAIYNYMVMIKQSWTWERLTTEERVAFIDTVNWATDRGIKGNYEQRWDILQLMYHTFLNALGYAPIGWRETEEK